MFVRFSLFKLILKRLQSDGLTRQQTQADETCSVGRWDCKRISLLQVSFDDGTLWGKTLVSLFCKNSLHSCNWASKWLKHIEKDLQELLSFLPFLTWILVWAGIGKWQECKDKTNFLQVKRFVIQWFKREIAGMQGVFYKPDLYCFFFENSPFQATFNSVLSFRGAKRRRISVA